MRKSLAMAILIAGWAVTTVPVLAQPTCISTRNIVSTRTQRDGRAMLFRMRDGSVWRNDLRTPCTGLRFNGFAWTVRDPAGMVCENTQSLRVLRTGQVCMLGRFTQVTPSRRERRAQR